MFFAMMLIAIFAMHYVVVLWLLFNTFGAPALWQKLLPALLSLVFISCLFLSRKYDNAFSEILTTIVYIWLGSLFLFFALVMALMILQIILAAFKIHLSFRLGYFALIVGFCLSAFSIYNAYKTPSLVEFNLATGGKLKENIKIAQITDTHLGDGISAKRLKRAIDKLKAQNPDIVFFTGDIFERGSKETKNYIEILKDLNPKYGKYAVLGNHEYYGGVNRNLALWQDCDIKPLLNTSVATDGLNIIGINDIRTSRLSKEEFLKIIKNSALENYTILLSHTPLYHDEAAKAGVNLMLSGHTHNGQIWPFKYLVKLQFKHINGIYKDKFLPFTHYVSNGTFYWGPPMRFLSKNEITLINLTKDETKS
jgi:predicted MPP superfamily phosphohydrolase